MRQHISPEQLRELTQEQLQRLREWWKPQDYDAFVNANTQEVFFVGCANGNRFTTYGDDIDHDKNGLIPLLSIGQMIGFLQDMSQKHLYEDLWMHTSHTPISTGGYEWEWHCGLGDYNRYSGNELCDMLWLLVKGLLPQK